MTRLFKNNAQGALVTELSESGTLVMLAAGHGARFPAPTNGDHFLATLVGLNTNGQENAWEIVKCTGRATDGLTIVRAQEGTTARTWPIGTRFEMRVTAGTLDGFTTAEQAAQAAPVQSVAGKKGAVTLGKADVGLDKVDNTADVDKPISHATQMALSEKASLLRPKFIKNNNDQEGGEIYFQAADNQPYEDLTIDYMGSSLRFFARRKASGKIVLAHVFLDRIADSGYVDLMPPAGSIMLMAGVVPPDGYLLANGAAVSRAAYVHLFNTIGTFFGAGDGHSTFNLPDLRDKVVLGAGASWTLGHQGGRADAVVVAHTHAAHVDAAGGHAHKMQAYASPTSYNPAGFAGGNHLIHSSQVSKPMEEAGEHSHGITIQPVGESGVNANLPPFVALFPYIKY